MRRLWSMVCRLLACRGGSHNTRGTGGVCRHCGAKDYERSELE